MTSPYALIGPRLVERGYAALPVMPNTKRPGELRKGVWVGKHGWREEYTRRLPNKFEMQIWSTATDAGVCVVAGPASRNLVAVDIDTDQPDIRIAILSVLPPTTLIKVGQKGETRFFRGSEIVPQEDGGTLSPSWNIEGRRVCDFIGPGRQTVLPPTIHPDTQHPYRWTGPDALEDVDPDDIPELPADIFDLIAAALVPFGYTAEQHYTPASNGTDDVFRRLNDLAFANLPAWVPALNLARCRPTREGYEAVADWRTSRTDPNRSTEIRKLNLKVTHKGAVDFGDGPKSYTAINLVMVSQACDLDTAFKFLSDRLERPSSVVINLSARRAPAEPAGEPTPEPDEDTPKPETPPSDDADEDADPLEGFTHCGGLVGDLTDWITETARRPNRVLAMGAAISIVGTLIGRRVCGPTDSATHLYVVGLAPTGSGKQHPLNCIHRLLAAAGASHHRGPKSFKSSSAVINFLSDHPLALCPQDEFGSILKRINGRKASTHEKEISEIYRTMWGTSFEPMGTGEWAGRKEEIINSPAFSIFGVSTPEEFYESLQGQEVENGFINRFLILNTDNFGEDQDPKQDARQVTDRLRSNMHDLYLWGGTEFEASSRNNSHLDPRPDKINWAHDGAREVYRGFVKATESQMKKEPDMKPFLGRASETAVRLATIMAAGRWGRGAALDQSDMEWGRDISSICFQRLGRRAIRTMIIDRNHGQVYNRILEIIQQSGGRAPRQAIFKALGKSVKSKKDMDNTLEVMMEGGELKQDIQRPPNGGAPSIWYIAA